MTEEINEETKDVKQQRPADVEITAEDVSMSPYGPDASYVSPGRVKHSISGFDPDSYNPDLRDLVKGLRDKPDPNDPETMPGPVTIKKVQEVPQTKTSNPNENNQSSKNTSR